MIRKDCGQMPVRPVFWLLLMSCCAGVPVSAQRPVSVAASDSGKRVAPLRVVENRAFNVGEKLTFLVRYGPIVAGTAVMSVPEVVTVNGRPCYHLLSEANTNSFFSRLYRVEDRVSSFADVEGIFSWRYVKNQREGSFRDERVVDFDPAARIAITAKNGRRDTVAIPLFVQDIISAFYYIRTQKLEPGDTVYVDNYDNGKILPLKITVYRREKIKVRAGKFNCLVVEPHLKTPGLYNQKGRLIVHLSDDDRKLPVMTTTQLYIKAFNLGNVVAELEKIEGVEGY
ncbi:MAG: DUF3108 domain-containing protein [candidate division KSB1 bacterium]|nr:DUF3108 domain-containing protein [candidate division KSB1 bacterium]MDZ7275725.1 DUF3108 domain-containing protein [candidate division KSB1 bacterium]MDZ7284584.1 DUF3108 domain-containing protein [candidate division KSB1 bacterium]MDZ7297997.1 DUF3108 domain-containing protein [candidate division KSB1 bacterium]MDZ7305835.1 DUF3108 domain-containing protein [candidate division KSB1 bacterium]